MMGLLNHPPKLSLIKKKIKKCISKCRLHKERTKKIAQLDYSLRRQHKYQVC